MSLSVAESSCAWWEEFSYSACPFLAWRRPWCRANPWLALASLEETSLPWVGPSYILPVEDRENRNRQPKERTGRWTGGLLLKWSPTLVLEHHLKEYDSTAGFIKNDTFSKISRKKIYVHQCFSQKTTLKPVIHALFWWWRDQIFKYTDLKLY